MTITIEVRSYGKKEFYHLLKTERGLNMHYDTFRRHLLGILGYTQAEERAFARRDILYPKEVGKFLEEYEGV